MTTSLPASTHVGKVVLQIADLDRSLAFYEGVLGFRILEATTGATSRVSRLGVAGAADWLLELREKPGVRRVPPRGLIGLYHFAILLPSQPDLGRFITHATKAGVHMGSADHLVSEALYLTDPDGLTVEVYHDRPRSSWQYRNGELVMASLPLDLRAVSAGAGDSTWAGLPAGTTIGHMHLYVDDLGDARRFYVSSLGLAPTTWTFPGALFTSAGGYHHHVGLNVWAAGSPAATDADAKLIYWELVLPTHDDIARVSDRMAEHGYRVERSPDWSDVVDTSNICVRLVSE